MERTDVKQLGAKIDGSIADFKRKMKSLEELSNTSVKRTRSLADRLDKLAKRVVGKEGIPSLSNELQELADEIRKLEEEQMVLKQKQKEMVAFDDKIESMVQKALREDISKKELEDQFDKLKRMKKKVVPPSELSKVKREALKLASKRKATNFNYMLKEFTRS